MRETDTTHIRKRIEKLEEERETQTDRGRERKGIEKLEDREEDKEKGEGSVQKKMTTKTETL